MLIYHQGEIMKVLRKQKSSKECIVCGRDSLSSVRADFYDVEGEMVACVFTPKDNHQSYRNRMHGGMITAILDETLGRAIQWGDKDVWGVTMEITVKFRKPVPLNTELIAVGKIIKETGLAFVGASFIEDSLGNVLATATGKFMKLPPEKITEGGLTDEEWFYDQENPKTDIDIKNANYFDNIKI